MTSVSFRRGPNGLRGATATIGMYLAAFVAIANISAIYLALPRIEDSLRATPADQQWIAGIYPLMEGGFALAAGTLGDLYGRRRILAAGAVLFVAGSLLCALAPNAPILIAARALQGVASAALLALPIAILVQMLPDPTDNGTTIKRFTLVVGIGASATPLLAGALVQMFAWQGLFVFSAVLGVAVLASLVAVKENTCAPAQHADFAGQALSILALLALSFAVINARGGVAVELIVAALGIGLVGIALLLLVERYARNPILRLRRCDKRGLFAAILTLGAVNFAWYGIMLVCTLLMQRVMKLNPFVVGLYLTPSSLAFFVANGYSTALVKKLGLAEGVALSIGISLLGIGWLALLHAGIAPWNVAAALVVASFGWGLICTPASSIGMGAVDPADQGFASAVLVLARTLFGVFGVAVLGTLLDTYLVNLETFTPATFLHGVRSASLVCLAVTAVLAFCILLILQRRRSGGDADLPVA